jgi:hypothetical protein
VGRSRSRLAVSGCEGGERSEEGRPGVWIDGEVHKFALTLGVDEACGLEFFDVVGERGRGDGEGGESIRTAEGARGFGDFLQELKAFGICECLEDCGLAGAREFPWSLGWGGGFCGGHSSRSWSYGLEMILNPGWMRGGEIFGVGSAKKSRIQITHPDRKRLIPFDTFNMFYRGELETTRLAGLRRDELAGV